MNLSGLSREALEEYARNLEAIVAECRGEHDDQEPKITDHEFRPGRPPQERSECGYDGPHGLCGYARAEHANQEEL